MTGNPPPRARLPRTAPTQADLGERDYFARLAAGSADTVRASAQAWRTGLTAFITLVTTGAVIKGRDSTASLPLGWRVLVIVLVGGGLIMAVLGLRQTLAAEAGTRPSKQTLQDIHSFYGTLATYQVHLADAAASQLRWGIRAATTAITLLIAGIIVTWVAPPASSTPQITVTYGNSVICGTLQASTGDELRLAVASRIAAVPLAEVTALTPAAACP